jgi:formate dehydrogenase maturation protein FdhE
MTMIKTWQERCEEHPDHEGIVSEQMIRNRMQEEIDELRQAIEQAEDAIAAEREACANLLLNVDLSSMDADHRLQSWTATVLLNFSDAIRARGEQ